MGRFSKLTCSEVRLKEHKSGPLDKRYVIEGDQRQKTTVHESDGPYLADWHAIEGNQPEPVQL